MLIAIRLRNVGVRRVVAVVGMGHVQGILSYWNEEINIKELLSTPQGRRKEKYIFGGLVLGLIIGSVYLSYRLLRFAFSWILGA